MEAALAMVCSLLLVGFGQTTTLPQSAAAQVKVSEDFMKPGLQGEPCLLPKATDVTVTVGGVTLSLKVSQSPRVTQDALLYLAEADDKGDTTIRRVALDEPTTYALYHDTKKGAAMVITCPLAGEKHPIVEGTVLYQGRKHHLRQSMRRKRDVAQEPSQSAPPPTYQLTAMPPPKTGPSITDYLLPPRDDEAEDHRHPPHPPLTTPLGGDLEAELEEFEREIVALGDTDVTPEKNKSGDAGEDLPHPLKQIQLKGGANDDTTLPPTLKRRRRLATQVTQDVIIDAIAIVAFDIYQKFYNRSDKATAPEKQADALAAVKKHFAIVMSEADMHYAMIGNALPYKIQLRLRGFIVSTSATTSPWTELRKEVGSGRPLIYSTQMLGDLRTWLRARTPSLLPLIDYYVLFTE